MEDKKIYIRTLFPRINDIKDVELADKVTNVWIRAWEMSNCENLKEFSAWPPEADALQLSNVDHTNQVVECVITVANIANKTQNISINLDYLIAAAILHDVDKVLLFDEKSRQVTTYGKYIAHIGLSLFLTLEQELPLEVVHAISTHSPNYSAMPVKTHEALLLSQVDRMMMDNWIMSKKIDISFKLKD